MSTTPLALQLSVPGTAWVTLRPLSLTRQDVPSPMGCAHLLALVVMRLSAGESNQVLICVASYTHTCRQVWFHEPPVGHDLGQRGRRDGRACKRNDC